MYLNTTPIVYILSVKMYTFLWRLYYRNIKYTNNIDIIQGARK